MATAVRVPDLTVEREGSRHGVLTGWLIYTGAQEEECEEICARAGLQINVYTSRPPPTLQLMMVYTSLAGAEGRKENSR